MRKSWEIKQKIREVVTESFEDQVPTFYAEPKGIDPDKECPRRFIVLGPEDVELITEVEERRSFDLLVAQAISSSEENVLISLGEKLQSEIEESMDKACQRTPCEVHSIQLNETYSKIEKESSRPVMIVGGTYRVSYSRRIVLL